MVKLGVMKEPKYEPLKMGNSKHANKYGERMRKYLKWKEKQSNKMKQHERHMTQKIPRDGLVIKDLSKDKGVYFKDGYYDTYFDLPLKGRAVNN